MDAHNAANAILEIMLWTMLTATGIILNFMDSLWSTEEDCLSLTLLYETLPDNMAESVYIEHFQAYN